LHFAIFETFSVGIIGSSPIVSRDHRLPICPFSARSCFVPNEVKLKANAYALLHTHVLNKTLQSRLIYNCPRLRKADCQSADVVITKNNSNSKVAGPSNQNLDCCAPYDFTFPPRTRVPPVVHASLTSNYSPCSRLSVITDNNRQTRAPASNLPFSYTTAKHEQHHHLSDYTDRQCCTELLLEVNPFPAIATCRHFALQNKPIQLRHQISTVAPRPHTFTFDNNRSSAQPPISSVLSPTNRQNFHETRIIITRTS